MLVVFEGTVGSGKTSLVEELASRGWCSVSETPLLSLCSSVGRLPFVGSVCGFLVGQVSSTRWFWRLSDLLKILQARLLLFRARFARASFSSVSSPDTTSPSTSSPSTFCALDRGWVSTSAVSVLLSDPVLHPAVVRSPPVGWSGVLTVALVLDPTEGLVRKGRSPCQGDMFADPALLAAQMSLLAEFEVVDLWLDASLPVSQLADQVVAFCCLTRVSRPRVSRPRVSRPQVFGGVRRVRP